MSLEFDLSLRMEDHDIIPSCLSAERHKPREYLLHYMGCEQFFQREEYLVSLNPEQIRQVEAKLQRIHYLRQALSNDIGEGRHLLQNLRGSLRRWRATREFQDGIKRVRELRTMHFALNGVAQREVEGTPRGGEYNPDIDTNAYLMRFKNGRPVRDLLDTRLHEEYPCYRVSMDDVLFDRQEQSLLSAPKGTINYIHFPANNMHVSQLEKWDAGSDNKNEGIDVERF